MKNELLRLGKEGALVKTFDTPSKYELASVYNYKFNTSSGTWAQGHYFTLWYDGITEENKKKLYEEANKHFEEHYL